MASRRVSTQALCLCLLHSMALCQLPPAVDFTHMETNVKPGEYENVPYNDYHIGYLSDQQDGLADPAASLAISDFLDRVTGVPLRIRYV